MLPVSAFKELLCLRENIFKVPSLETMAFVLCHIICVVLIFFGGVCLLSALAYIMKLCASLQPALFDFDGEMSFLKPTFL